MTTKKKGKRYVSRAELAAVLCLSERAIAHLVSEYKDFPSRVRAGVRDFPFEECVHWYIAYKTGDASGTLLMPRNATERAESLRIANEAANEAARESGVAMGKGNKREAMRHNYVAAAMLFVAGCIGGLGEEFDA